MDFTENSVETGDAPRWYVVRTHLKQESRAEFNLKAWNVEVFSPLVKELRVNQFSSVAVAYTAPLFPRYIFARFDASKLLFKVSYTRGVQGVVGFGEGPVPVEDVVIEFFRSRVGADGSVRVGDEFQDGDEVIVKDGALHNLKAVVSGVYKGAERVSLLLAEVNYQARLVVGKERIRKLA
ncbi:MAG TPA: transcription termination/antitermination NusG family protein [Pyrinomonadaceae bacterium]|jgi:transcriptional antiterminator RfaH